MDGRTILKYMLQIQGMGDMDYFIWLSIGSSGSCEHGTKSLVS